MKKQIPTLLFLLLWAFTGTAQQTSLVEIVDQSVDEKTGQIIFERYCVLSSNRSIRHGYYKKVTRSDKLVQDGTYENSEKKGNWTFYYVDKPGQVKAEGRYRDNRRHGKWEFYDKTGTLDSIVTYNKGIQEGQKVYYASDGSFQKEFHYSGGEIVETTDLYQIKAEKITEKIERIAPKYKSTQPAIYSSEIKPLKKEVTHWKKSADNKEKLEAGDQVLRRIEKLTDHYEIINQLETRINNLYNKLAERYKSNYRKLYRNQIRPLEDEIEAFHNKSFAENKVKSGEQLVEQLGAFKANFEALENSMREIETVFPKVKAKYQTNYPSIYNQEIDPLNSRLDALKDKESLDKMTFEAQNLLEELKGMNQDYTALSKADSKLRLYTQIEASYKNTFRPIYKEEVRALEDRIDDYKDIGYREQKAAQARAIFKQVEMFEANFKRLSKKDERIHKRFTELGAKFEEGFEAIYDNELSRLEERIDSYEDISTIADKHTHADLLLKKLQEIADAYKTCDDQQQELTNRFETVRSDYSTHFSSITGEAIDNLADRIEAYKETGNISKRLEKGEVILETIAYLENKFTELSRQNNTVDSMMNAMNEKYEDAFPDIYKTELEPLQNQKENYNETGTAKSKLLKGKDLIKEMDVVLGHYPELQQQKDSIRYWANEISGKFETALPNIYKEKIKPLEDAVDDYMEMGNISKRLRKGESLYNKLADFEKEYKRVTRQANHIEEMFSDFKGKYENEFPNVYKTEGGPIEDLKKEYGKMKSPGQKKSKGKILIKQMQGMLDKYPQLRAQKQEINKLLAEAAENYRNDFPNVYDAQVEPMEDMKDDYLDLGNSSAKISKGDILIEKLKALLADYPALKEQLVDINKKFAQMKRNYETAYEDIYKNKGQVMEDKVDNYRDVGNRNTKRRKGKTIQEDLEEMNNIFPDLNNQSAKVKEKFSAVSASYAKNMFPSIYKTAIKPLEDEVENYYEMERIEAKLNKGKNLIANMTAMENAHDKLKKQKTRLGKDFNKLKSSYRGPFPNIYEVQIEDKIGVQMEAYKDEGQYTTKYEKGQKILEQISDLQEQQAGLMEQSKTLKRKFPLMVSQYEQQFESIYDRLIEPLEGAYENYQDEGNSEAKARKAKSIIEKMNTYNKQFKPLVEQQSTIKKLLGDLVVKFKEPFPNVYEGEVEPLKQAFEAYNQMGNINSRLQRGKNLVEKIKRLDGKYPQMNRQRKTILKLRKFVDEKYDEHFGNIHDAEVEPLLDEVEKYMEMKYSDTKIEKAKTLLEALENLKVKFAPLKDQKELISKKYRTFEKYFSDGWEKRRVWRKGNRLYGILHDKYKEQGRADQKKNMGKNVLECLQALNELKGNDISSLHEQLQGKRDEVELKRAFGLY